MLNCIIVDDERTSLERTRNYISQVPYLELLSDFRSPFDTIQFVNNNPVDLVFLDVHLRGMSGLDMLGCIQKPVQSVIVSTYKSYAVDAFDMNATDYLVKPVTFERFKKACSKALKLYQYEQLSSAADPALMVNVQYRLIKIDYQRILFIEGMKDYIRIHLNDDKPVTTHMTMKAAELRLREHGFVRIHKSFIINVNRIRSVHRSVVQIDSHEIPCSSQHKLKLNEMLNSSFGQN